MYEQFGAFVADEPNPDGATRVAFRVFFPNARQYVAAGKPRIQEIQVRGTFQSTPWDVATALVLRPIDHPSSASPVGTLYWATLDLQDGYYQYKYFVRFDNGDERWVSDPCARYGAERNDESAFVVGGAWPKVKKLAQRLPLDELVLYELMIDDFAAELVQSAPAKAPLEVVREKVEYIHRELGANAILFMPWTAWPGHRFSWGYNPAFYFSVEARYTTSPARPLDKLALLRDLINACHDDGIHVIMDGVFNHAETTQDGGFPYARLYEQEFESPYVGTFSGGGFFTNLDFNNECTHQFVYDVCRYWIDEFGIDGIRFDYTLGFYHYDDRGHGLNRLLFDLRHYLRDQKEENFALILEQLSDNRYDAINVTNQVGATACWFDPFMFVAWRFMDRHKATEGKGEIVDLELLRVFDAHRCFDSGRGPITYIENHDHESISGRAGGREQWARTQPYAIALFTAPGTPMIYNGQEWAVERWMPETGEGRVVPRPLPWPQQADGTGRSAFELYRRLIAMRLAHPALRGPHVAPEGQPDWARDLDPKGFGVSRSLNVAVLHRWGAAPNGSGEARYVVVLNFAGEDREVTFEFPRAGQWEDLLSGWKLTIGGDKFYRLKVGSNWGHVFYWAPGTP